MLRTRGHELSTASRSRLSRKSGSWRCGIGGRRGPRLRAVFECPFLDAFPRWGSKLKVRMASIWPSAKRSAN